LRFRAKLDFPVPRAPVTAIHRSSIMGELSSPATVKTFLCATESDTEAAGREIARALPRDVAVHLSGKLGAGKTFLARVIAAELGANPREVSSPSFAIVHRHPVAGGAPIIHIDAHRLSDNRREWLKFGIAELLAGPGVKLIEWPREEFAALEERHVEIMILVREHGAREISVTP
jgi:tRNA threonylcarbamoyladenosine biosynthesis protein TsaE